MPMPELPKLPSGADTNADRSIHRSRVGFSTSPLPIRLGRSVEREAWSDGLELSSTVIGYPECAENPNLSDQPPATESSARFQVAPNARSRPKGSSHPPASEAMCRASKYAGP